MEIKLLNELTKLKTHITTEIIDYISNSVVIKTILRKPEGNVCVLSFDHGAGLNEKKNSFDTFIQVIEGKAMIVIEDKPNELHVGESIIIPAHETNKIKAICRLKMILTTIKGIDEP